MEALSTVFKVTLPAYLKSLPIPSSFGGFGELSGDQWLRLLPFLLAVTVILYSVVRLFMPSGRRPQPINPSIKKESPKVVNLVDIEDIDKEKVSYCRCWRSSKFPLCDGTHNNHNTETGDNVGPLVIKKTAKK